MIRWLFLDVGNVLLDEDALTFHVFRRHVEAIRSIRPDLTVFDLLDERESHALRGARWPLFEVASRYLDEATVADLWNATDREVRGRYGALNPPIPGVHAILDHLAPRFRLGLIANQPRECRSHLSELGLLARFEVVALSEEVGHFKPTVELFLHALARAQAAPAECLMIGDRLDNDLAPAAALGMPTLWLRWPVRSAKGGLPDDPECAAYLHSLERCAAAAAVRLADVRTTLAVDRVDEVADAVGTLMTDDR